MKNKLTSSALPRSSKCGSCRSRHAVSQSASWKDKGGANINHCLALRWRWKTHGTRVREKQRRSLETGGRRGARFFGNEVWIALIIMKQRLKGKNNDVFFAATVWGIILRVKRKNAGQVKWRTKSIRPVFIHSPNKLRQRQHCTHMNSWTKSRSAMEATRSLNISK